MNNLFEFLNPESLLFDKQQIKKYIYTIYNYSIFDTFIVIL